MASDIRLGCGDSDNVPVVLKENGTGANLTGSTVVLSMKNKQTSADIVIPCIQDATVNGEIVPYTQGGITIKFNEENTSVEGIYLGKFIVTILGSKTHFPSKGYVYIYIGNYF